MSIKRELAEYTPAEDQGASDRHIDSTVELSAIEMKPLVPRAGGTAADQRPMSVDTDAVSSSSEKFNNDLPKLVMKTDKALVEELEPETPTGVLRESLKCEEIVDTSVLQIQRQIDEIGKVVLQERVPERVVEQIVNIPAPQIIDDVEVIRWCRKSRFGRTSLEKSLFLFHK